MLPSVLHPDVLSEQSPDRSPEALPEGPPADSTAVPAARREAPVADELADRARAAGLTAFELARLEEARRRAAEMEGRLRDARPAGAMRRAPTRWLSLAIGAAAAVGIAAVVRPALRAARTDALPVAAPAAPPALVAAPGTDARRADVPAGAALFPTPDTTHASFGGSHGVRVRTVLPGQVLDFPMTARAEPGALRYGWVRVADRSEAEAPRPLAGSVVLVPNQPGLYHLVVQRTDVPAAAPDARRVLDDVAVAVLVPFAHKLGPTLNGYRLGTWPGERFGGERPTGFIEVTPATATLRLSPHLTLADFVTHDGQRAWPRYVALNPALVDKVELIVREVGKVLGRDPATIRVNVHSGFRTPLHNNGLEGSAFSSRHQYGDAADIAVDADGDGRFSAFDSRVIAAMAEHIERKNPHLTGGLGIYLHANEPYIHVDTRGRRARWWR